MTDNEIRDRLMKVVEAELDSPGVLAEDIVDALLPVVDATATQRAADALEAVARRALSAQPGMGPVRVHVRHLFDRAAALRAGGSA